jgi:DNA-binding MarR family transcriptional regulator
VTELYDRLGYLLKHAQAGLSGHTGAALARFHIDGRQLAVLTVLRDCDGTEDGDPDGDGWGGPRALAQHQAASRLGVDRTTMVELLDELEKKGLVQRRPDPADRRRKLVYLTGEGESAVKEGGRAAREAERAFLVALTPAEADQLRVLLQRALGTPGHP